MALPMVLHGLGLQVNDKSGKLSRFAYSSECGRSCIWVDADWDTHVEYQLAAADQQPQPEGEMKIF